MAPRGGDIRGEGGAGNVVCILVEPLGSRMRMHLVAKLIQAFGFHRLLLTSSLLFFHSSSKKFFLSSLKRNKKLLAFAKAEPPTLFGLYSYLSFSFEFASDVEGCASVLAFAVVLAR